jgi:NtrC-family two-component system sensor histidine kinase KinB
MVLCSAPNGDKRLLATVAHELRNPLASLRLSLEMLVGDYDQVEPQAALRLIRRAQSSTQWLQTLTDNLTSAECIQAGRLETRTEPVDLLECMQEAVLLVEGLLRDRGQSVRISSTASSTLALADRDRTIQIVANLLTNASRYSVRDDDIELHVSREGTHLRVRVTDHGPGISAEDQRRIFSAWVRGAQTTGAGLGLGLNIVKSLVQRQGGRVGVESALNAGATFWFTLPAIDGSLSEADPGVACRA